MTTNSPTDDNDIIERVAEKYNIYVPKDNKFTNQLIICLNETIKEARRGYVKVEDVERVMDNWVLRYSHEEISTYDWDNLKSEIKALAGACEESQEVCKAMAEQWGRSEL